MSDANIILWMQNIKTYFRCWEEKTLWFVGGLLKFLSFSSQLRQQFIDIIFLLAFFPQWLVPCLARLLGVTTPQSLPSPQPISKVFTAWEVLKNVLYPPSPPHNSSTYTLFCTITLRRWCWRVFRFFATSIPKPPQESHLASIFTLSSVVIR